MDHEAVIKHWVTNDPVRMEALTAASEQKLPGWCLAAGFVRNLAWDKLHGFTSSTPLNDIDLIYFDQQDISNSRDREIERELRAVSKLPWSVKNQARMHERNMDGPYTSTEDAMSFWVEVETAVGAALDDDGDVLIVAPFGIKPLFDYTITLNPKRPKRTDFEARICSKRWLQTWPRLVVNA
ncbi:MULTISPECIES: nucleotidyltransferase family protein [unclassified Halomonas]|uniref:nucleotidyltransferase family protein n=1 Tax=unclassified Halomonas TaxID=2609666 RepID=UPI000990768B|nr:MULTISPECIES: nucleotidyltransferase family protein [unclassified Halomonas]AQU82742.1 nitrate reductase [Halomonas sp. 'Soap Lake \